MHNWNFYLVVQRFDIFNKPFFPQKDHTYELSYTKPDLAVLSVEVMFAETHGFGVVYVWRAARREGVDISAETCVNRTLPPTLCCRPSDPPFHASIKSFLPPVYAILPPTWSHIWIDAPADLTVTSTKLSRCNGFSFNPKLPFIRLTFHLTLLLAQSLVSSNLPS